MLDKEILKSFEDKNVLITGGTGLIGRQLIPILSNYNANVTVISLDNLEFDYTTEYIHGDLTDFCLCKEITKNKDFVFHLAGIKGSTEVTKTKPASFFVPLLQMNTNILEACRMNDVEKVVYTSSIGAYSNADIFRETDYHIDSIPMDSYPGYAKRMAELQIQAYKIQYGLNNYSIVRPCSIYGPGDNFDPNNAMVIPSLMNKISKYNDDIWDNKRKVEPIKIWGDGNARRDFLYSKDAAEGIIQALYYGTDKSPTGFVNIGSGIGYPIKELVYTLNDFIDFKYEFDTTKDSGYSVRVMNIDLANELIHFEPKTSLFEGLKDTWYWYKNHQNEYLNKKNYFKE